MCCEAPTDVNEWQVLPFRTTSTPCCAIFAMQQHAHNHKESHPEVLQLVQQRFYVDNCLKSFPSTTTKQSYELTSCAPYWQKGGFTSGGGPVTNQQW